MGKDSGAALLCTPELATSPGRGQIWDVKAVSAGSQEHENNREGCFPQLLPPPSSLPNGERRQLPSPLLAAGPETAFNPPPVQVKTAGNLTRPLGRQAGKQAGGSGNPRNMPALVSPDTDFLGSKECVTAPDRAGE